jgi:hypothetical protein
MTRGMKMVFGIFMVLVYLGMAGLLAVNFFDWSLTPLWNAVRWFFVVIFAAYGIYRGYRELKGEHTYGMRVYDDNDQEKYSTYDKDHLNQ